MNGKVDQKKKQGCIKVTAAQEGLRNMKGVPLGGSCLPSTTPTHMLQCTAIHCRKVMKHFGTARNSGIIFQTAFRESKTEMTASVRSSRKQIKTHKRLK